MPALIRGVARTAVIAGTATATSNAVNRRMAAKNVEAYGNAANQYQEQTGQPVQVAAAPVASGAAYPIPAGQAPAPAAPAEDMYAQLERIGQLKAQGILTEEEFAAEKAKILG
jgi:Short C-terminal domain